MSNLEGTRQRAQNLEVRILVLDRGKWMHESPAERFGITRPERFGAAMAASLGCCWGHLGLCTVDAVSFWGTGGNVSGASRQGRV